MVDIDKLVSVIMSTYNESTFQVSEAIESILQQSYEKIEFLIIIDNPNNRDIIELVFNYSKIDNRITIIKNEKNIGLASSLNKGINIAKGEFIARMDADDISHRNRIKKQINFMEINNLDMVASNRIDIDDNGNIISNKSKLPYTENVKKILPIGNFITHPTVCIKTQVLNSLNGYREFACAQDYDLWLRVLSNNYKIGIIDEPLLLYRVRENSISNSNKYKQYLIGKYQKKLFYQRVKNNHDEFNNDDLEKFLKKHKYYNENKKQRFNNGYQLLNKGMISIKKKKYFDGVRMILFSLFMHKELLIYLKNTLSYKLYVCKNKKNKLYFNISR